VSTSNDILLVEDEDAISDPLRRMLVRAHYTVRIATDGTQALAALNEELPAVLVLDLALPGLSGFTILEHLHQHQIAVPVIIITGNPLYQNALQQPDIVQILIKPFPIEELLAALYAIIGSPSPF
jgi:DNA-binding response OmpR family regulator